MHSLPDSANKLIDELSRLPGIGRKTAQRLAFHFLNSDNELSHSLSQSLLDIKMKIIPTLLHDRVMNNCINNIRMVRKFGNMYFN